ncbi:MAG TPA: vWA domain-containing protein [Polyangiaceae bacterium]|nr:vWA domain-containing protein [Polyangiaceae bacterium]
MKSLKRSALVVAGTLAASHAVGACSANSGTSNNGQTTLSSAGGTPAQTAPVGTAGAAGSTQGPLTASNGGAPSIFMVPPTSTSNPNGGTDGGGCPAIRQKPEQVVMYKPVALFIMQDRTGSMVSGFPSGCACSWSNSTMALSAFVNDPMSAGLDVGLSFFGGTDKTSCDGMDCSQANVPIEPIAMAAQPIIQAMNSNTPNPANITPLECGLRGMINACLLYASNSPIGEPCVDVLVTDGNTMDPTPCDGTVSDLVQIVADGHSKGVNTYTLGLQGSDPNFLDQIAQAGGTMAHIDASGGVQQFVAALNSIRESITIKMPLPCTWKIPPPPTGTTFDPNKVNVQYTPPGAATGQPFGHVSSQADCARANGDAWYYDNSTDPSMATQVIACDDTCNGTLHNAVGEVDVVFGCATIPAVVK